MLRKIISITVVFLVIAAGAAAWLFFRAGRQGEGVVERWIGRQVLELVDKNLNPKLAFSSLDYQYPLTVVLQGVTLTSDDPRAPGSKIDVLAAGEARLTLAERPQAGKPINIEQISFYRPAIRLVKATDSPGFVGFSNMVKRSGAAAATQSDRTPQARLRDILNIRRIELVDGRIEYDPRIDGTEPMYLDGITAGLAVEPNAQGYYKINTNVGRKPVFDATILASIDLDVMRLRDVKITAAADLSEGKLDYLPPQLQKLLAKYEAKGKLDVVATGELALMERGLTRIESTVKLASANYRAGDFQFPVETLDIKATLGDGQLEIERLSLAALGGKLDMNGAIQFTPQRDATLAIKIDNMQLQDLLAGNARANQALSGTLNGGANIEVPLLVLAAKLQAMNDPASGGPLSNEPWPLRWGMGNLQITKGCLVKVPVLSTITNALAQASRLSTNVAPQCRDRLDLEFSLEQNRVQMSEIVYVGDLIAGRGNGFITLDKRLDLTVNGGPVERVQELFGQQIGGVMGKVTDALAAYRVTGTTEAPSVSVSVAPGLFSGISRLGEAIQRR